MSVLSFSYTLDYFQTSAVFRNQQPTSTCIRNFVFTVYWLVSGAVLQVRVIKSIYVTNSQEGWIKISEYPKYDFEIYIEIRLSLRTVGNEYN